MRLRAISYDRVKRNGGENTLSFLPSSIPRSIPRFLFLEPCFRSKEQRIEKMQAGEKKEASPSFRPRSSWPSNNRSVVRVRYRNDLISRIIKF